MAAGKPLLQDERVIASDGSVHHSSLAQARRKSKNGQMTTQEEKLRGLLNNANEEDAHYAAFGSFERTKLY